MNPNAQLPRFLVLRASILPLMLAAVMVLNLGEAFAAPKRGSWQDDRPTAAIQMPKSGPIIIGDAAARETPAHNNLASYVALLQSRKALLEVAEDPEVATLPLIKETEDVVLALAEDLNFQIDQDASIITISSRGLPPSQGAIVVNSLVRYACQTLPEQQRKEREKRLQFLQGILAEYNTRLDRKNQSIAQLSRLVLEPGGHEVDRPVLEAELLNCLRRLRQVRLDRIAIETRLEDAEESDPARSSLETEAKLHERQEAMLASERDHLADQLTKSITAETLEGERQKMREVRDKVGTEIERLRIELSARGRVPSVIYTAQP